MNLFLQNQAKKKSGKASQFASLTKRNISHENIRLISNFNLICFETEIYKSIYF